MTKLRIYQNYKGVFDGNLAWGQHPLILVIDFMQAYLQKDGPFYSASVVHAYEESEALINIARELRFPIVFSRVCYNSDVESDGGIFTEKIPLLKTLNPSSGWAEFPDHLVLPDENVITKKFASVFFATPFSSLLAYHRCDSLIIAGCTTSGCVRATAVDGMQHGYRVIVAEQCVGDRQDQAHVSSLIDIQSKYGEVADKQIICNHLHRLRGS